jgi:hypothetical protein
MNLPFVLLPGHLPVIVPRPKVRSRKLADGTVFHEAHNVRFLTLKADRGLFDIGFMLDVRQFAFQSPAEQFTILAIQRRLTFSDKIKFPNLKNTGNLISVENTNETRVWAMIPETVILTSKFTSFDLHDQRMALDELDALRETTELAIQGCPNADIEVILKRFHSFKTPDPSDIRRALKQLVPLGFVREYIKVDGHNRRAVVNMRMIAATRSGILSGMIAAEDMIRRVDGTTVSFGVDLNSVGRPAKRVNSTSTGKRRKLTRADYQSKYHSGKANLKRAEKLIKNYESSGYLTPEQFTELRNVQDDPTVPSKLRGALTSVFETARTDPHMEIPTTAVRKKETRNE